MQSGPQTGFSPTSLLALLDCHIQSVDADMSTASVQLNMAAHHVHGMQGLCETEYAQIARE